MSRNTLESSDPDYSNNPDLYDSYVKFFVYGDQKGAMTENVRIFNDNIYEYDSIGFPFMTSLGWAILNYEKNKR